MTPVTLNAGVFASPRGGALRSILSAAWQALRMALRATGPAPATATPRHRLGAWDLARSGVAREHLVPLQPRPTIHLQRGARHG